MAAVSEVTHAFFALILWVAAGLTLFAEFRSPSEGIWQLGVAIVTLNFINITAIQAKSGDPRLPEKPDLVILVDVYL